MYECLFEENQIGTMKLKNRLIVPAMSTRFVGEDGRATEQFTAYHETRAKGGWALIITEDFLIDEGVGIKKELPGLWDDGQIEGYKKCTDRIHAAGGKICAQIYHAGRNTHSGITGIHNVGPSPICDPSNREVPHELTAGEIKAIEEKFADAALRARKAGFDAVELHGAHGYLIAQIFKKLTACGRYTKLQYDFSIRCMKRICPKIDMYRKGFIMQTPPCNRYHNQLGYNRGNRSTKDTEVKNKNEYRIHNSIQQGSAHIQLYTGSAVPRTLSHCHIEVQHKKADIVKGNSEQILITGIINFLRGIQPA